MLQHAIRHILDVNGKIENLRKNRRYKEVDKQIEILKFNNTMIKIKSSVDEFNSRMEKEKKNP